MHELLIDTIMHYNYHIYIYIYTYIHTLFQKWPLAPARRRIGSARAAGAAKNSSGMLMGILL